MLLNKVINRNKLIQTISDNCVSIMLHKTVRGNKTEADNFKQDTCARNKLDNYAPGKMNDGKNSLINP